MSSLHYGVGAGLSSFFRSREGRMRVGRGGYNRSDQIRTHQPNPAAQFRTSARYASKTFWPTEEGHSSGGINVFQYASAHVRAYSSQRPRPRDRAPERFPTKTPPSNAALALGHKEGGRFQGESSANLDVESVNQCLSATSKIAPGVNYQRTAIFTERSALRYCSPKLSVRSRPKMA